MKMLPSMISGDKKLNPAHNKCAGFFISYNYMKKLLPLLLFVPIILSCSSQKEPKLVENTGYAQGSTYQIKYLTSKNLNFGSEIEQIFVDIDNSMSTYKPESEISRVNKGETWVKVDPLFMRVLNRSLEIAEETSGDFDPTVGPIVSLWGFGFDEVRRDVNSKMVEETKAKTGYKNIQVKSDEIFIPEGFQLDFNAIAQGFTVDYIVEYLESHAIENYMVEVGGEVRTRGRNEKGAVWAIGVDKPKSSIDVEDRFQIILELKDAALATSGNYRKYWVDEKSGMKYSHTIDPHTGTPALNQLLSASIISKSTMDADAYATVCMVKGLENCKSFLDDKADLEGYLVYASDAGDWEVFMTDGFSQYIRN